jgi:hypothetical protein
VGNAASGTSGTDHFDCRDASSGDKTAQTANTWTNDTGDTSSPEGICAPAPPEPPQPTPTPTPPGPTPPGPTQPPSAPTGARVGYCAAAGNTNASTGAPIPPGTFLNLEQGQPATDSHYTGATPAVYVMGQGLTCGPVPAGYAARGVAPSSLNVPADTYTLYAP